MDANDDLVKLLEASLREKGGASLRRLYRRLEKHFPSMEAFFDATDALEATGRAEYLREPPAYKGRRATYSFRLVGPEGPDPNRRPGPFGRGPDHRRF